MAQKVQVILLDDVDGSTAEETVSFALDGVNYEIDLNNDNAAALRDALATWIGHARRSGGRKSTGRRRGAGSVSTGPSAGVIREWARTNGYQVSERGRIPSDVREAYEAAN